jgi:hypothetical protein
MIIRKPRSLAIALQAIFCTALMFQAPAQDAAARAASAGQLSAVNGQRTLHLYGSDVKERGFAHGYFLAEQIRDDFDAALTSLPMFGPQKFEAKLLPWEQSHFEWDADSTAELDGVYEGMLARLGADGMKSKVLERAYTRKDIAAVNVIADYFGPACSGFTAWGSRTEGGVVIHGRNLDFPIGRKPIADQVLFISDPLPKRDASPARLQWICLGWPGLIVQFSGMNSSGLVACVHDGYNVNPGDKGTGYVPRGLLLRRILECVDPAQTEPAEAAAKLVAAKPTACGNLFHLSWPGAAAKKYTETPSAVLEFDPADQTPKIRRMDGSDTLVVTNHFRVLNKPVTCDRFTKITDGLELLKKAERKIGQGEAQKLLMAAEQPVAAHSIYFYPDSLEFRIALTKENVMSPHVPPVAFSFKELVEKTAEHASR